MDSGGSSDIPIAMEIEASGSAILDPPPSAQEKPTIPEHEFGSGSLDSTFQPRVFRDMGKLFQQETLSDVMLMAEGQSIPCHKFLLAAASDYFYNKLVVASNAVDHNLLEIEGISFQILKIIVSYLYTGYIKITDDNVKALIPACKKLKLQSACEICEKASTDLVNPMNCIGLYYMAVAHGVQQLKEKAEQVMVNAFKDVTAGSEFLSMSVEAMEEYIRKDDLKIANEDPVFQAVVSWIEHQPEQRNSLITRLISSVRLRFCSTNYLTQVVASEPLMENLDCHKQLVAALSYKSDTSIYSFPTGSGTCDANVVPRKGYKTHSNLILIGGESDPGSNTEVDCWRMENEGWKVMEGCAMPQELFCFSACVMRGGILVSGGSVKNPVTNCWLLSTSQYQWSLLPDLNMARCRHGSVCVDGQPYVIGGEGLNEKEMSSVECLEKASKHWAVLSDIPQALVHPISVTNGQYIYVFGGRDIQSNDFESCYFYNTSNGSWQRLSNMPGVCALGSGVVHKGIIYLVGGFGRSTMSFNPGLNAWTTLSGCVHEHADAPTVVWKDRLLVCGGRSRKAQRDDGEPGGTSVIEEYDAETDTWTLSRIKLPLKLHAHFLFGIVDSI